MKTVIAIRIPFYVDDNEDELSLVKSILNREPDDYLDSKDWSYESKIEEWTVNKPDNQWFLDYPLEIEDDASEINHDISLTTIQNIVDIGISKLKESNDIKDIGDPVLKTIYFYNGAASGLSDIK